MADQTKTSTRKSRQVPEMSWNEIDEAGSYLLVESGQLARVPDEALAPGHSPLIHLTSNRETRVAKLTTDPATPISILRSIAADNDYAVSF